MIGRMAHHAWYRRQTYCEPASGVHLGRVSLGGPWDAPGPALGAGDGSAAFLDGEIYGAPLAQAQGNLLAACTERGVPDVPDTWLAALHGLFAGVVWDAAAHRLLLVNDRFGMKPLYYAHVGRRLVFATEIKALLADCEVPREPDLQGVVSFFSYGQPFGEQTFLAAVHALPPGAVLEYLPAEDRLTQRPYVRLQPRGPEPGVQDREHIARLAESFKAAVDRRLCGARLGLSLSGGLDSRAILAVVDEKRFPITTVCLGIPGSIDQKAARCMTALTAGRHRDFVLGRAFLDRFEEHLRNLVWLGLWLRRELRPLVERVLLDSRCLDRGIFAPDTVRRTVAAHSANRANHTFVLLAMLSFELGQRMLLDGEAKQDSSHLA
jgi:asparagine synthase (glutamine-hydrolysing)